MVDFLYSLLKDDLWSYGRYAARIACVHGCLSQPDTFNVLLFASVKLGGIWECVSVLIRWIINTDNEHQ